MELAIGLAAPSLLSVEQAVNNPGSPEYRHYLNFAQTNSLGASVSTASALASYLESYGLTVTGDQLSLNVEGTVTQVESALHTTVGAFQETYSGQAWNPDYDHVTGLDAATGQLVYTSEPRIFYSDTSSVELPVSIASAVSGISGLDGLIAEPQISAPTGTAPGWVPATVNEATYTPTDPNVSSTSAGGVASVNLVTGAANYTYNSTYLGAGLNGATENLQLFFPSTMPTLYGALPLWTGSGTINGARDYGQGTTIAVIEVGCLAPSIFESFSNATFGSASQLMNRLTYIALGSTGLGSLNPSDYNSSTCVDQLTSSWSPGWSIETAADVEYAATMAPEAHIDLLSVPSTELTAFDAAYQFAAQYLIENQQCDIPSTGPSLSIGAGFPAYDNVFVYGLTIDQYGGSACDASIFSNSYGTGEQVALYTAPMYFEVQNELLEQMAAEGGTSLFASGDGGGVATMLNDFQPADSPAVTSVGGGQITATSGQDEFPSTNVSSILGDYAEYDCVFYNYAPTCSPYYTYGLPVTVAPVTGSASFTYWSGPETGAADGSVGGGFGQSMSTPQAWWQNGLDTYSVGARIDPTVSGQAGENMTIWYSQCYYYYVSENMTNCQGPYAFLYGGTSFATPLMAGDLALVEEQLQQKFGQHDLGDTNALFYAAHNAYEAGATSTNIYEPMENLGCGYGLPSPDWCFSNNYAWAFYNMSDQTPMDQGQPSWFATLFNPAIPPGWTSPTQYGGSSLWNYLQGLGLPEASLLDKVLVGQNATDHALSAEPFYIEMVGPDGTLEPVPGTLTSGVTYTFEILTTLPGNLPYSVTAYSGGANNGTYGGGTTSSPSLSSTLQFTYAPIWTDPMGAGYQTEATTYGYFLVSALATGLSNDWSFLAFAVAPPAATGNLQICIDDIYGVCETGSAEETMFWVFNSVEWYNIQGPTTLVTLNGLPVESAVVQQVSVYTNLCSDAVFTDCTMNASYYAQGQTIGTYLTDARGTILPWMNAWIAEDNGRVVPEVFTLTAYVDGMVSNTVTVWVEPQSGSFYLNDLTLGENGLVTGTVYLNDMPNLEWANISLVPAPGTTLQSDQYVNESFVGVNNVAMAVTLNTNELPVGTPAVVAATAEGWNNLSIMEMYCSYGVCFYYNVTDVQNPMVWQDPTVFLPATISASVTGTVTGTDTVSWSGANYAGAVGTLSLVSGAGSTVLATGISGSYALDTTTLQDGSYSVDFTETAPGAVTTVRSVSFYADNEAASDNALISQLESELTADAASLAADSTNIASLQSQVTALTDQVASLTAQVSTLQSELATSQANATSIHTQLVADAAQIASLTSEIQTLQNELNAKNNYVAPAWYTTIGSGGLAAIMAIIAVIAGLGAYLGGRRVGKKSQAPAPDEKTSNR